jgi:hypothetical protein
MTMRIGGRQAVGLRDASGERQWLAGITTTEKDRATGERLKSRTMIVTSIVTSQSPAAVRISEPSRAVKYQGWFPLRVSCHS